MFAIDRQVGRLIQLPVQKNHSNLHYSFSLVIQHTGESYKDLIFLNVYNVNDDKIYIR